MKKTILILTAFFALSSTYAKETDVGNSQVPERESLFSTEQLKNAGKKFMGGVKDMTNKIDESYNSAVDQKNNQIEGTWTYGSQDCWTSIEINPNNKMVIKQKNKDSITTWTGTYKTNYLSIEFIVTSKEIKQGFNKVKVDETGSWTLLYDVTNDGKLNVTCRKIPTDVTGHNYGKPTEFSRVMRA